MKDKIMDDEYIDNYDFKNIEQKWQSKWNKNKLYEADPDHREKYFINFPFPYINGSPHLGHGYSLMKAEVMARYQKMLGKNVLFPFGFHATGEPIVGTSKLVKKGDKNTLNALSLSGVADKDILKFEDPEYIISYFKSKWINTLENLGLAIDWRRQFVTTQLTPVFSKFVEWQYRKLKKDGYVVQGSHPVIWCPADRNPTGDHDRLVGEGARVIDYILLKFYSEELDAYLLPATLRPETLFGVTNIFLNPDFEYVKVRIDKKWYIVTEKILLKLKDQKFKVEDTKNVLHKELFGQQIVNPANGKKVIILPATFIDPESGTGVVMSVPAHAPVDWINLMNLKDNAKSMTKWGIKEEDILNIKPIAMINVDEYGEFPAEDELKSRNINNVDDIGIKEATRVIYRKEANYGKMKTITGKYEGMNVEKAREMIIKDFIENDFAIILKEPAEKVICRCGTRNHVKYLENQWFLKFSDEDWKNKTHKLIDEMNIYPEDARKAFHNTVDWLENKACARRSGLGTPMPWDEEWIIETLSDSVIYMAYYIISKYVNNGMFQLKHAKDEIFDYIMLDDIELETTGTFTSEDIRMINDIKAELEYFYGFDLRTSGKDLLNNHLTFMLMHHTAIFPEKYLPKGVAVNGYVAIIKPGEEKAEKMSKSKGNFKTIDDVINAFGVDATRLGFLIAGEGFKDAQFSLAEAESYLKWIQNIYDLAMAEIDDNEEKLIDKWLFSRVQNKIADTNEYLSNMQTRSAFQSCYHELLQDIKWYNKRRGTKGPAFKYAIETMIKMTAPFIPHVVEEIWEKWGGEGFASESIYPKKDETLISRKAENAEKYLSSLIDDLKGLLMFFKERGNEDPLKVEIYLAPEWKYHVYDIAFESGLKNLIGEVMKNDEMRKIGKEVPKYCQQLMKSGAPPEIEWSREEEEATLLEAKIYLEKQINLRIDVIEAELKDNNKSKAAIPRRPGINFIY